MRISDQAITVRPTLIVGLGGTGVQICKRVEEFIKELLDGAMPPFIRFLKLDTAAVEDGAGAHYGEPDFMNLFHYMDLGAVVRNRDAHPELYPHMDWMSGLKLDAGAAANGCQGIPRLGRVFFTELRDSLIHPAVTARFSDLRSRSQDGLDNGWAQFVLTPHSAPVIHVASSVCGGTGAGMLIDMAHSLRRWSGESFPGPPDIIGHLMLPEAFPVIPDLRSKLAANALATLQQIEYLSDPRRGKVQFRYRDSHMEVGPLESPFSFMYLLNGHGDTGSGNRRHLAEMIARVIRAMVVEPMGTLISEDANNQLNDSLGQLDRANGRRRCFASYGFWYGTSGDTENEVPQWINQAMGAIASGPIGDAAKKAPERRSAIKAKVDQLLNAAGNASAIPRPARAMDWQMPATTISDADIRASVLTTLNEYLTTLGEHLTTRAEQTLPADKLATDLLAACDEMLGRHFSDPTTQLGIVGECMQMWQGTLNDRVQQQRDNDDEDFDQLSATLYGDAETMMSGLARKTPPAAWTPDVVGDQIGKLIADRWTNLAAAALRAQRAAAAGQASAVLGVRNRALGALLSEGNKVRTQPAGAARAATATRKKVAAPFSTSLYPAGGPAAMSADLAKEFREEFVRPTFSEVVLSITAVRGAVASGSAIREAFDRSLAGREGAMAAFFVSVKEGNLGTFRQPLDPGSAATAHPYYDGVHRVAEMGIPKIHLDPPRVSDRPLPTAICQQRPGTCVPELLGPTCREVNVDLSFEAKSGALFELVQLCYGFSLPAISTYEWYEAATLEYVPRRGFTYADLWLDRRWFEDYHAAQKQLVKRPGSGADEMRDHEGYVGRAALIGRARGLAKSILDEIARHSRQMTDVPRAIEASQLAVRAEYQVAALLRDAKPEDALSVQQLLGQCVMKLRTCAEEFDKLAAQAANGPAQPGSTFADRFASELGGIAAAVGGGGGNGHSSTGS